MIQINRTGNNYSGNLIDDYLTFNSSGTWIVVGTGSASHSSDHAFEGTQCLKIQNTAPTSDIVATNNTQNTTIKLKTASCGLMFYLYKESDSDIFSGSVEIFKNAVSLGVENFELAADQDAQWYKFITKNTYDFVLDDVVTFKFTFNGDVGFTGTKTLYVDGMHLYDKKRLDTAPPLYEAPPCPIIEAIEENITIEGTTVVADGFKAEQFYLSALNTAPSSASDTGTLGDIRITADYIYICTATDTWKRTAISTW